MTTIVLLQMSRNALSRTLTKMTAPANRMVIVVAVIPLIIGSIPIVATKITTHKNDRTVRVVKTMVKLLTPEQKRRAEQLISIFENGTPVIQYDYVENLQDGRGYTCGRAGFTTGTGDAYEVVKRYTQRVPNNPLAKFLPELKRLDSLPEDSPKRGDVSRLNGFSEAWKQASKDKVFRSVQDAVVDEWYYQPAMNHADQVGIQTALGKAIFYDTIIQHGDGEDPDGLPALITATKKKMGGIPKTGIDEKKWIAAFLDVRRADLAHAHDPDTREEWSQSVGRVDSLKQLVKNGNFDLRGPFTITWEGDRYTIS